MNMFCVLARPRGQEWSVGVVVEGGVLFFTDDGPREVYPANVALRIASTAALNNYFDEVRLVPPRRKDTLASISHQLEGK